MHIHHLYLPHKILLGQTCQGEWNGLDATEMAENKIKDT